MLLVWLLIAAVASISVTRPMPLVGGRSIRMDIIRSSSRGKAARHADVKLVSIHACAAVDMPFLAYDPYNPTKTGCNSPGYRSEEIYSDAIATDAAGSLATKFRVRTRGQTIFMRRRLVDLRSPIVYLQIRLQELGVTPAIFKTIIREYRIPEKILPIDQDPQDEAAEGEEGEDGIASVVKEKNFLGVPIKDNGRDDQRVTVTVAGTDVDGGRPGTSVGILFIVLFGCGCALVAWARVKYTIAKEEKKRTEKTGNYAIDRKKEKDSLLAGWIKSAAQSKKIFSERAPPLQHQHV